MQTGPVWLFAPRGYGPTTTNPQTKARTQLRRRYMLLGETLGGDAGVGRGDGDSCRRIVAKTEAPITIEASRRPGGCNRLREPVYTDFQHRSSLG